jgi:hypothetical protein
MAAVNGSYLSDCQSAVSEALSMCFNGFVMLSLWLLSLTVFSAVP